MGVDCTLISRSTSRLCMSPYVLSLSQKQCNNSEGRRGTWGGDERLCGDQHGSGLVLACGSKSFPPDADTQESGTRV